MSSGGAGVGYARVLVGTDGSDTATAAVRHAAGLAVATGSELVLVTAYSTDPLHERQLAAQRDQAPEEVRWMITDVGEAEEGLRTARQIAVDAGVGTVRARAEHGDAADVLISAGEELLCDVFDRCLAVSRFVLTQAGDWGV